MSSFSADGDSSQEDDKRNSQTGSYTSGVTSRLYRTASFRKEYLQDEPEPLPLSQRCQNSAKNVFSCENKKKKFLKYLPFLRIYRKYKVKTDLPNDVIAGFTVGIMQLPQGMAYAMLADLPPVVGLYMAFFPVLIYFILGTSRHISMGTVAVVSLMIGSVVSQIPSPSTGLDPTLSPSSANLTLFNGTDDVTSMPTLNDEDDPLKWQKVAMASSICFIVGVIQMIFGFCNLGFVTTYMSDPLVSGFTTGAAVHVFTSQVKYIFGLKLPRFGNLFQIVFTYKAIFENIAKTNWMTIVISAVCIIILYIVKVHINQRFKDKMKIPVPIELVVVILGTLASHFGELHKNFNVKIIGDIPAGLPEPKVPNIAQNMRYISDAIVIAVVAFAQSVSLASLMAKKHMYTMDSNQEFIAYGAGNIFGSFFSCYPFAASVSRSSVQESAGGRTQITSVFSASLVLVVIIVIGPLLESLPNCVLSSIIVVALRTMFLQALELKTLWKISVYDFLIWIVTFLSVVIMYVDLGLWIGLIFSCLTVVVRAQRAKAANLQKIPSVNLYADEQKYNKTQALSGIRVVGFNSPLYYANGDLFVKQVFQIAGMKPERARKHIKRLGSVAEFRRLSQMSLSLSNGSASGSMAPNHDMKRDSSVVDIKTVEGYGIKASDLAYIHHLIIDCSSMCFIDSDGNKILKMLMKEFKTVGVKVFLAGVKDDVWNVLSVTGFIKDHESHIFLSVHDAVEAAKLEGEELQTPNFQTSRNNNTFSAIPEESEAEPGDKLLQV